MNSLMVSLRNENGGLRGLTGSGEPGLATLLGGTSPELDANGYAFTGGPGQTSSATRLALAVRDTRLAAVSSGTTVSAHGFVRGDTLYERNRLLNGRRVNR